jgi:hypothetical protein
MKKNHMKKIILALFVLISIHSFAQEFKIKKGEVLLDGKPIAKISTKVLREYKISNLDGTNTITAYMRICNMTTPGKVYIEVFNENDKKSNDLDFAKYSPFNVDRSIVQTLFAKEMITENGVQLEKINSFLNDAPTGLGEKYGCKQQNAEKQITDALELTIDDYGTVFNKNKEIGRISMITSTGDTSGAVEKYEVRDLDSNLIGTWYGKFGMVQNYGKALNQEIMTYDNKVFKVEFDNGGNFIGYKMSKDITAMNIIKKLIANGYNLGHQNTRK